MYLRTYIWVPYADGPSNHPNVHDAFFEAPSLDNVLPLAQQIEEGRFAPYEKVADDPAPDFTYLDPGGNNAEYYDGAEADPRWWVSPPTGICSGRDLTNQDM